MKKYLIGGGILLLVALYCGMGLFKLFMIPGWIWIGVVAIAILLVAVTHRLFEFTDEGIRTWQILAFCCILAMLGYVQYEFGERNADGWKVIDVNELIVEVKQSKSNQKPRRYWGGYVFFNSDKGGANGAE
ncbi:MAG: hypothetical protein OEV93_00260 [Candidatus Moranbacteria bacterium]|nr:hypothetical protein [Candidatus Moranbacteria bacterium]